MYALVMWIGDEPTTSVVPWTDVEVVGKKTRAKWGPKFWPVQLLRQSENKDWLESLSVIANGDVLWSRSVEENNDIAKKRIIVSDDKDDEDSGDFESATQPWTSPKTLDLGQEKSIFDEVDNSDEDVNSTLSDCTTEKKIDTKDESTQTKSNPEHFSDLPEVTPEFVQFMDCFVTRLKSQLPENTKFSTPVGKAKFITPKKKTELLPGTEIWIAAGDLCNITKKCYKTPKEMVRRLMRLLVKKEELMNMTPMGKSRHKPIPRHIFSAVKTYVNQNVYPGLELDHSEYARCLSLMCYTLRNPKPSTLAAEDLPKSERSAKSATVTDEDSDSSVDDRKRTRAARRSEKAITSKNKNTSSEGKRKYDTRKNNH